MVVADTPSHVRRRVADVFASMSGAERVRLASEMSDEVREVALAGIRARHPRWDEPAVEDAWLRMLHGDDLVDELARCSSSS